MGLHWDVFIAGKITNLTEARELYSEYEIVSIRGNWYVKDPYLVLVTNYPGSAIVEEGILEYQTDAGVVQVEFDKERLEKFIKLTNDNNLELEYWESFRFGSGLPKYRLLEY